jgi:hypothetical protein
MSKTAIQDEREEILAQIHNLEEQLKELDFESDTEAGGTPRKVIVNFSGGITVNGKVPATIRVAKYNGKWSPIYGKGELVDAIYDALYDKVAKLGGGVELFLGDVWDVELTAELASDGTVIAEY